MLIEREVVVGRVGPQHIYSKYALQALLLSCLLLCTSNKLIQSESRQIGPSLVYLSSIKVYARDEMCY